MGQHIPFFPSNQQQLKNKEERYITFFFFSSSCFIFLSCSRRINISEETTSGSLVLVTMVGRVERRVKGSSTFIPFFAAISAYNESFYSQSNQTG